MFNRTLSIYGRGVNFLSQISKNCLARFCYRGLQDLKILSELLKGMTWHLLNFVFAVYVDASQACNLLSFQLGPAGIGAVIPTRSWSLKVIFYSCQVWKIHNNLQHPNHQLLFNYFKIDQSFEKEPTFNNLSHSIIWTIL